MATRRNSSPANNSGPIAWAIAIVIVMVSAGYTFTIVDRCQVSTFDAVKLISISFGKCDVNAPVAEDKAPPVRLPSEPGPKKITSGMLPCRWVWVFLGKYSHSKGGYILTPAFRFADKAGPTSPFPNEGDEIVLVAEKTAHITGYTSAPEGAKCNGILNPPAGYRPETAKLYEAGKIPANTQVTVNKVAYLPNPKYEPTYVWALVGPAI